MNDLPAPLVPPEVDLRDFAFMPLDVHRLLTSETWIEGADMPKIGHASMCLWCEAWHQVPASSLPANERVLAHLAMCTAEQWAESRERVLAGWVKCSDGLWYHPVVAEKALQAWIERLRFQKRAGAGNAKRHGSPFNEQHFNAALAAAHERLASLKPSLCVPSRSEQGATKDRKGEGEGEGQIKKEVLPPLVSGGHYAIDGKLIKITEADFPKWETTFHAIPDLRAELENYDLWLDEHTTGAERKKWYHRARQRMNAIHQDRLAAKRANGGSNLNETF